MIISCIFPQMIYIENEYVKKSIIEKFNLNNQQIVNLKVGDWFKTKINNNVNEYVVKPMDTFFSVSKKLNIDETTLRKNMKTKHLFVGQKIKF